MAVACAGFRVKGTAHHKTMFEVLPLAMGDGVQDVADFLERCRRERNAISYDAAGTVSASEAAAALDEICNFETRVERWITDNHPSLRR